MKNLFRFWEISANGQVLNHKLTFKGSRKFVKEWMEENLNKHRRVLDRETDSWIDSDEVIYNGYDKVQIKECIINWDGKAPKMIVNCTYYPTNN